MRISVSVPESLFARADRLARRLKKSRSQLYSDALAEYVLRHDPGEITARLNRAIQQVGDSGTRFEHAAARRTPRQDSW